MPQERPYGALAPALRHLLAVMLIAALAQLSPAAAQQTEHDDPTAPIKAWSAELDNRTEAIESYRDEAIVLEKQREGLDELTRKIEAYVAALQPRIEALRLQLKKLGPPPGKDEPPEAEEIEKERERLYGVLGELDAADKTAGVLLTRTAQLIDKIRGYQRGLFTRQLLRRTLSPFNPALWRRVREDAEIGWFQLSDQVRAWIGGIKSPYRLAALVLIVLIVWAVPRALARRLIDLRRRPPDSGKLAFFQQARSALWVGLARMAPLFLAALTAYLVLYGFAGLTPQVDRLWQGIVAAVLLFAAISSLTRTLLAPYRPTWRMLPISDRGARRLTRAVPLMAALYGVDLVWTELNGVLAMPLSLTVAQSFIYSILFAILLIAVLLTPLGNHSAQGTPPSRAWPRWLKLPFWALAITIVATALFGYIALANFLAAQIVKTGLIAAVAMLLHVAIREFTLDLGVAETAAGAWLRDEFKLDEPRRRQIAFVVGFVLNLMLLLFAAPLLLLQWGFSWSDIRGWLSTAFFGFNLGSIHLSVATLLIAAALFVTGIVLTRAGQRWLDRGPLNIGRMQAGIANSIRTGVGYAGFLLSALVAVSYAGFNFTNLAIVAGALSVGIGFGLQSIVNNFVSGLILLVERPIKVGDWVLIGGTEGFVRRISVRATEIETFDRSSVIIPNSELITGVVTNLTHGNTTARIVINVGVSYDCDANAVHALLLEIGRSHAKVLERPPTKVVFEDFADSALVFSLRVHIPDVRDAPDVRTQLRLMIFDRFRAEGIEIPFPQRDVHIKSGGAAPALAGA